MPIFKRYCKRCGKLFRTRDEFRDVCDTHESDAKPKRASLPAVEFPRDVAGGADAKARSLPPVPFPSEAPVKPKGRSLPAVPFPSDDMETDHFESDGVFDKSLWRRQKVEVDVNHEEVDEARCGRKKRNHPDDTRKAFDPKKWKPTPAALALLQRAEERKAGGGGLYTRIAKELGDSEEKREAGLVYFEGKWMTKGEVSRLKFDREHPVAYCKKCGRQFYLNGKDDDRKFCTTDCARLYEEDLRRAERERIEAEERDRKWREEEEIAKHGIPCPICGRKFLPKKQRGRPQKYCTTKCTREAAYRKAHGGKDPKDHPTDLAFVEKVMQMEDGKRWKYAKNFNDEEARYARQYAVRNGFLDGGGKARLYPYA